MEFKITIELERLRKQFNDLHNNPCSSQDNSFSIEECQYKKYLNIGSKLTEYIGIDKIAIPWYFLHTINQV